MRARGRAFTLLETLVALALVLLLAGLVLPSMSGFSDSAVFKETCDQFSSAVSVCRSEAQRRGTAMELITRTESDGRVALVTRVAAAPSQEDKPADTTVGGQLLMVLPQGYSVDHEPLPVSSDGPVAAPEKTAPEGEYAPVREAGSSDHGQDERAGRVAVFWASGAASTPAELYLRCRGGRVVMAEINSWTGAVKLAELSDKPKTDDQKQPDEEPVTP